MIYWIIAGCAFAAGLVAYALCAINQERDE